MLNILTIKTESARLSICLAKILIQIHTITWYTWNTAALCERTVYCTEGVLVPMCRCYVLRIKKNLIKNKFNNIPCRLVHDVSPLLSFELMSGLYHIPVNPSGCKFLVSERPQVCLVRLIPRTLIARHLGKPYVPGPRAASPAITCYIVGLHGFHFNMGFFWKGVNCGLGTVRVFHRGLHTPHPGIDPGPKRQRTSIWTREMPAPLTLAAPRRLAL